MTVTIDRPQWQGQQPVIEITPTIIEDERLLNELRQQYGRPAVAHALREYAHTREVIEGRGPQNPAIIPHIGRLDMTA